MSGSGDEKRAWKRCILCAQMISFELAKALQVYLDVVSAGEILYVVLPLAH